MGTIHLKEANEVLLYNFDELEETFDVYYPPTGTDIFFGNQKAEGQYHYRVRGEKIDSHTIRCNDKIFWHIIHLRGSDKFTYDYIRGFERYYPNK